MTLYKVLVFCDRALSGSAVYRSYRIIIKDEGHRPASGETWLAHGVSLNCDAALVLLVIAVQLPNSLAAMSSPALAIAVSQALIIAYKEDTQQLEACLSEQGFDCKVIRQEHRPDYQDFSPSYRCLLNHCNAWKIASERTQPTLIVEADFVPVKGFGTLPLPYDPTKSNVGLAWLYTCAPQIYSVSAAGFAVGFSTSMVAYIVTPTGAERLQALAPQITLNPGPTRYSAWDSTIEEFLRQQKLDCYVPWRNYGEHGGKPNLEHQRAGLSPAHRADVLYGPLAFQPLYVETFSLPNWRILFSRLKARVKGFGRLLLGKYLRRKVIAGSSTPLRLLKFATSRQLTWMP